MESKSQTIAGRLLAAIDLSSVKNAHIYKSVPGWNEVDTTAIADNIRRRGIKTTQPAHTDKRPPKQKFDLIIVPVLGFDKQRNRLGLGGGYYDQFLAAQPDALKVGLCFYGGLLKNVPHEEHDIPLDMIITEQDRL